MLNEFAYLVPLLPFLAFGAIVLFTRRDHKLSAQIALVAIGVSAIYALMILIEALVPPEGRNLAHDPFYSTPLVWFDYGGAQFKMGWLIDPLAAVMLFMVTTICFFIFMYSIGYMREKVADASGHAVEMDDPRY